MLLSFLRNKKGQNTAEYAILIGIIVAAAIAMQTYLKRNLQAGVKFTVDKAAKSDGTGQYEPYYLESSYETKAKAYSDTEKTEAGGKVTREVGVGDGKVTERSGYQKIKAVDEAD